MAISTRIQKQKQAKKRKQAIVIIASVILAIAIIGIHKIPKLTDCEVAIKIGRQSYIQEQCYITNTEISDLKTGIVIINFE